MPVITSDRIKLMSCARKHFISGVCQKLQKRQFVCLGDIPKLIVSQRLGNTFFFDKTILIERRDSFVLREEHAAACKRIHSIIGKIAQGAGFRPCCYSFQNNICGSITGFTNQIINIGNQIFRSSGCCNFINNTEAVLMRSIRISDCKIV